MVKYKQQIASETEQRILEAARQEFIRHGLDGTSMQQIADTAQINKSLVHYYFRSKENLFNMVFIQAFQQFVPKVMNIMVMDVPFFERMELLIANYIDMLAGNSFIPGFILHEINQNPDRLYKLFEGVNINPAFVMQLIQKEIDNGVIRPIDPRHFFINVLALCIFPFPARPLIQRIFFEGSDQLYEAFLQERKKEVSAFIIESIRLK